MKKIICMCLCGIMLMGSLTAFAAVTAECEHPSTTVTSSSRQTDCYEVTITYTETCDDCNQRIDRWTEVESNNKHKGSWVKDTEIHDGEEVEVVYCSWCGEYR